MAEQQPIVDGEESSKRRLILPLWVVAALGIVALIVTGYIITLIASPLSELVFSTSNDVPIPDGATLESEDEDAGSASRSYFYTTDASGCDVAVFYANQGAQCTSSAFLCNPDGTQRETDTFTNAATCTYTEDQDVTGYSWQVFITTNYPDGAPTRFRILVFE